MKLEEVVEQIEYVRYKIDKLQVILSSETIDIQPEFVSEMMVDYDYDNLYAPVLTITIALSQIEYRKIVQDKENVKFIVKLDKVFYDDSNTFLYSSNFINETFCTHIFDENPIMEEDLIQMTQEINQQDDADENRSPMDMKDVYDFALFIEKNVKSGNTDINITLKSGNITDVIVHALQSAGLNKVLMSPTDNNSSISNKIFPLMNTVEFFNYLQDNVGIYNRGVLFFMDYNLNFFIDKNAYCTAWRPNEYKITNMYVLSQKSQYNPIVGQYIDDEAKENNVFTNTESINITNRSVVNNVTIGNKKVLLNPKSGSISYIDEDLKQRGASITNIEIQKEKNTYSKNEHKLKLIENEFDINIILKDIDLELLSPNKCFKLIFQNTTLNDSHGGTYRLSKCLCVLTKMGDELDSYIICDLKKHNNYSNEFGGEDRFEDWWTEIENTDEMKDLDSWWGSSDIMPRNDKQSNNSFDFSLNDFNNNNTNYK